MIELSKVFERFFHQTLLQQESLLLPTISIVMEQILLDASDFTFQVIGPVEERKKQIFTIVATKYIQGENDKAKLRREVFIEGSMQIGNLRQVAKELNISWVRCIGIYSEGLNQYSEEVFKERFK